MRQQHITKQEIAQLLGRFMAGKSSLDEERALAEYFRTHEVSDEWKEYKEMFALFDSGTVDIEAQTALPTKPRTIALRWIVTSIAASIALLIGLSLLMKDDKQEYVAPVVAETVEPEPESEQPIIEEKQEGTLAEAQTAPKLVKKHRKAYKPALEEPVPQEVEPVQEEQENEYLPQQPDPFLLAAAETQNIRSRGERLFQEVNEIINNAKNTEQ